ncbi:MAG: hypothetical protein WHT06_06235 [Desulfobacterales bacterium]
MHDFCFGIWAPNLRQSSDRGGLMDMLDLMGILIVLTALVRLILA